MKTTTIGLTLLVFGTTCWAQPGELYDADVNGNTSVNDPASVVESVEGQWLAFSIPAVEGTHSPCCWRGKWNGMGEVGCSLESRHQSYGSRSGSPLDDNIIVLSKINRGEVSDMRVVGESCPVDAGGARVTWIGDVDEKHALDWLEAGARSNDNHAALHAMAIYRGSAAGERLYKIAGTQGHELAEEAIFWLGHARGEQGFKLLKSLLDELPQGKNRREINFALSQNDSRQAAELLHEISQSDPDPEQRGEAMFWLAQEYPQLAGDWLIEALNTERDEGVLEQAVFAISQLPDGAGDALLLDLARDDQKPRQVRRQAIFWLANSGNDSSIVALTELIR